jgi:hypothetical protein
MGSDHKRTPSTWYVRATYAHEDRYGGSVDHEKLAEFDAWLNEVKSQAWDESAKEACGGNWLPDTNGNPGRPNLSDMKRRNPYRKEN